MTIAGHHSLMEADRAPKVFNYVGVKIVATRHMRSTASLAAWRSSITDGVQLSEVFFRDATNSLYSFPSDMPLSERVKFDNRRSYQEWLPMNRITDDGTVQKIFDGSTSSKMYQQAPFLIREGSSYTAVRDYDTNNIILSAGFIAESSTVSIIEQVVGVAPVPGTGWRWAPVLLILDVRANPFDITKYTKWGFYNGNDNASQTRRTWVEGEILGSVDLKKWWRLDVFNSTSIPNTNNAVAYTGDLVPRAGDAWSDLDLAERNWTTGISVD